MKCSRRQPIRESSKWVGGNLKVEDIAVEKVEVENKVYL
jgi:hypothetical protein